MDRNQLIARIETAESETEIALAFLKYHLIQTLSGDQMDIAASKPAKPDHDATIDALLNSLPATAQYNEPEEKAFLAKQWVDVKEAVSFFAGEKSEQTIRNMCVDRQLYSNIDEKKQNDKWLICPRSIALHINRLQDPRLKTSEYGE